MEDATRNELEKIVTMLLEMMELQKETNELLRKISESSLVSPGTPDGG